MLIQGLHQLKTSRINLLPGVCKILDDEYLHYDEACGDILEFVPICQTIRNATDVADGVIRAPFTFTIACERSRVHRMPTSC